MARARTESPSTLRRRVAALNRGTAKHIPDDLVIPGVELPPPEALAMLNVNRRLAEEVASGRATLAEVAADYLAALPALQKFVADYTAAMRDHFGAGNPILRDFGIRPMGSRPGLRNLAMLPSGTAATLRSRLPPARPRRRDGEGDSRAR